MTSSMKTKTSISISLLILAFIGSAFGQQTSIKRTISKTDKLDFGSGGTIVISGYPVGSVSVEGTQKGQIEIEADITIEAATEQQADQITRVVGFSLDESSGRVEITSLGPFNGKYLKKIDPKFPKNLINAPVRIDYTLKVPRYSDLQIDGGKGSLSIKGVDGSLRINFIEADGTIDLIGGSLNAVFGSGNITVSIPNRSWRGRNADVQLANGTLNVFLPAGLNADLDALILRSGAIVNKFSGLVPRSRRDEFTQRVIYAKSGFGGIPLKFTVGDGQIFILTFGSRAEKENKL